MSDAAPFLEYNYLQEPAVIAADWIGFICLFGDRLLPV